MDPITMIILGGMAVSKLVQAGGNLIAGLNTAGEMETEADINEAANLLELRQAKEQRDITLRNTGLSETASLSRLTAGSAAAGVAGGSVETVGTGISAIAELTRRDANVNLQYAHERAALNRQAIALRRTQARRQRGYAWLGLGGDIASGAGQVAGAYASLI